MNRPLWLRIILQPVLIALLSGGFLPLISVAMIAVSFRLRPWGIDLDGGGLLHVSSAIRYLIAGALAAFISWLMVRQPRDGFVAAVGTPMVLLVMSLRIHLSTSSGLFHRLMVVTTVYNEIAALVGCAAAVWLIEKWAAKRGTAAAPGETEAQ